MDTLFDWSRPILEAFSKMLQDVMLFLPNMLGALGLLLIGWVLARFLRRLAVRLALRLEHMPSLPGLGRHTTAISVSHSTARIIGDVVFWVVMLLALTSATNLLGLRLFSEWLDRLVAHLPRILSGVLIIWAGVVFGSLARDAVTATAGKMAPTQRSILARGAQLATLVTMILIGVEQLGVNTRVVTTILALAVGASLLGLAVAFSIGARSLVRNLIGIRYLSRDYSVGERISIGDCEGTILDITATSVVIETERGRMTVPAQLFSDKPSLLIEKAS